MGKAQMDRALRHALRESLGHDNTAAIIRVVEIMLVRGFFGRLWWLISGR